MRIVSIGDAVTVEALRLMGIPGTVVETPEEARDALERELGGEKVILVASETADMIRERVDELKTARREYLVLEIASSEGAPRQADETARLVSQAIGIKL